MSTKSSLTVGNVLWGLARFVLLAILFFVFFAIGGGWVAPALPDTVAEPGPFSQMTAVYIVSVASALVVILMIRKFICLPEVSKRLLLTSNHHL